MVTPRQKPPFVLDPRSKKRIYTFPDDYVTVPEEKKILKQMAKGYYIHKGMTIITNWELFKGTRAYKKWLREGGQLI